MLPLSIMGGATGALLLWSFARPDKVPTLIQVFQGLLTPVIASVTAFVAWQQWKANIVKLRLDAYERRYAVYLQTMQFLATATRGYRPEFSEVIDFGRGTLQADFLFGDEISKYLKELRRRALTAANNSQAYESYRQRGIPEGLDYQKFLDEMHENERWLVDQYDHVIPLFMPYLDLRA